MRLNRSIILYVKEHGVRIVALHVECGRVLADEHMVLQVGLHTLNLHLSLLDVVAGAERPQIRSLLALLLVRLHVFED